MVWRQRAGLGTALFILGAVAAAVFLTQSPHTMAEIEHVFTSNEPVYNTSSGFSNGPCTPLMVNGDPQYKANILLVGKDYSSAAVMRSDFEYFMDFDGNNRGLFAIRPFKENKDRFNIWMIAAGDAIADYDDPRTGRGLIKDAGEWFAKCPHADYKTVLAKEGMGRSGFALNGHRMFVKDVHRKVRKNQGAAGFLHEWGHGFGGLKDEYYSEGGRDASGTPNCADTREQAEQWWGDIAQTYEDVGYYKGCAYNEENWRPHKKSIMGNGGLYSYGPVNRLHMERILLQYN